jgi:hypothetical protein
MPGPDRTIMQTADLNHRSFIDSRLPCGGKLLFKDCQPPSQDVASGIDVSVMRSRAHRARPLPHGQTFKPCGPHTAPQAQHILLVPASGTSTNHLRQRICTEAWFSLRSSRRPAAA